jgi:hypothetical protein
MGVSRSCVMVRLKLMTLAYVKPMSLAAATTNELSGATRSAPLSERKGVDSQ